MSDNSDVVPDDTRTKKRNWKSLIYFIIACILIAFGVYIVVYYFFILPAEQDLVNEMYPDPSKPIHRHSAP